MKKHVCDKISIQYLHQISFCGSDKNCRDKIALKFQEFVKECIAKKRYN